MYALTCACRTSSGCRCRSFYWFYHIIFNILYDKSSVLQSACINKTVLLEWFSHCIEPHQHTVGLNSYPEWLAISIQWMPPNEFIIIQHTGIVIIALLETLLVCHRYPSTLVGLFFMGAFNLAYLCMWGYPRQTLCQWCHPHTGWYHHYWYWVSGPMTSSTSYPQLDWWYSVVHHSCCTLQCSTLARHCPISDGEVCSHVCCLLCHESLFVCYRSSEKCEAWLV